MGGKSSGGSDNSAMMMAMMQGMGSMSQQEPMMMEPMMYQPPPQSAPPVFDPPPVEEVEPIDWTEQANEAKAKAEADQLLDQTRRAKVSFLEDEDLDVTDSLLAGELE